ncbi:MAG: hypothetical protein PHI32_02915 [Dysgonamonadaceae bacterium]|nr:hypothetical protein [Dysgonamonadaceae bacterium]MDD4729247.1 hypothetical protein [Dysgonamonadaceae bacterium]
MKRLSSFYKSISLLVLGFLTTAIAFAQDETPSLDVNINTNGSAFYTQIWFWVVVGLVFILLLVALLRGGGGRKD